MWVLSQTFVADGWAVDLDLAAHRHLFWSPPSPKELGGVVDVAGTDAVVERLDCNIIH